MINGRQMVEYTTNPQVPGKLYFRCDRMRATLSTESCSGMWKRESEMNDGTHGACRLCPLGAVHAGETAASMSPLKGTLTCARCHRVAGRLIGAHVCPSCYNRSREQLSGRNAKGTLPIKLKRLEPRRIRYLVGDEVKTKCVARSLDTDELIISVLRDEKKSAVFAFNAQPPKGIRQLGLW